MGAMGVLVCLIATATGNAYVLLSVSALGLVLMAVFCRQQLTAGSLSIMLVAAGIAAAVCFALAR